MEKIRRNNRWLKDLDHHDLKDLEDRKDDIIMKKWYASKTLWINILAIIGIIAQQYMKESIMTPEFQALLIPVINVFLRAITKEKIEW